jgi:hypothetical protein
MLFFLMAFPDAIGTPPVAMRQAIAGCFPQRPLREKEEPPRMKAGGPSIVSSAVPVNRSKRSGRVDLRKTNDPVREPHGPQVMTMRHWITSFRKCC